LLFVKSKAFSKRLVCSKNESYKAINLQKDDDIISKFNNYWRCERQKAIKQLCEEEGLNEEGLRKILSHYLYTNKTPLPDNVLSLKIIPPSLLQRKQTVQRVTDKIKQLISTFEDSMGNI
jgi:type I restriction enzyme, R subunit